MVKIAIIDYGMSNLLSISRAVQTTGAQVFIATKPEDLKLADKIILPGVGAFPNGMKALNETGLANVINEKAKTGKPILGICLGMQMLLSKGTEIETTQGLNLIPGNCIKLPEIDKFGKATIIPHVGWEEINTINKNFTNFNSSFMYFVHSFFAEVSPNNTLFTSKFYNTIFASGIIKDNVIGYQFHPEKSGEIGLALLNKFCLS